VLAPVAPVAPVAPRWWKVEDAYLCIFTRSEKADAVRRKKHDHAARKCINIQSQVYIYAFRFLPLTSHLVQLVQPLYHTHARARDITTVKAQKERQNTESAPETKVIASDYIFVRETLFYKKKS